MTLRDASIEYRPEIDGLRALAVIPVLLYHARLGASEGFVVVDVFFVISGFVITAILIIRIEDLFVLKRFSRQTSSSGGTPATSMAVRI
jgi:peptidoglycan/LPS O-acetylase OafA/YrhL